jgi:hypothetical protein
MALPPWRTDGAIRLSWWASTPEPDWSALVAAVAPLRDTYRPADLPTADRRKAGVT